MRLTEHEQRGGCNSHRFQRDGYCGHQRCAASMCSVGGATTRATRVHRSLGASQTDSLEGPSTHSPERGRHFGKRWPSVEEPLAQPPQEVTKPAIPEGQARAPVLARSRRDQGLTGCRRQVAPLPGCWRGFPSRHSHSGLVRAPLSRLQTRWLTVLPALRDT